MTQNGYYYLAMKEELLGSLLLSLIGDFLLKVDHFYSLFSKRLFSGFYQIVNPQSCMTGILIDSKSVN